MGLGGWPFSALKPGFVEGVLHIPHFQALGLGKAQGLNVLISFVWAGKRLEPLWGRNYVVPGTEVKFKEQTFCLQYLSLPLQLVFCLKYQDNLPVTIEEGDLQPFSRYCWQTFISSMIKSWSAHKQAQEQAGFPPWAFPRLSQRNISSMVNQGEDTDWGSHSLGFAAHFGVQASGFSLKELH